MEIKINIKYHIEIGSETVECETIEQAEKKLRSLRKSEIYCHLYRTEFHGKSQKEVFLIS